MNININTPKPRVIGGGVSDLRGYHEGGDLLWNN